MKCDAVGQTAKMPSLNPKASEPTISISFHYQVHGEKAPLYPAHMISSQRLRLVENHNGDISACLGSALSPLLLARPSYGPPGPPFRPLEGKAIMLVTGTRQISGNKASWLSMRELHVDAKVSAGIISLAIAKSGASMKLNSVGCEAMHSKIGGD